MTDKLKRCRYCKEKHQESEMVRVNLSWFCNYDHATQFGISKAKTKIERDTAVKFKKLRDSIKTYSEWNSEAQSAFNRYIRVRDKFKTCISSGKPLVNESVGGGFDAGHYRSRGAASHLRFNVFNCHGQSKHDNRYLSGNVVDYRIRLIERIGLERVERLESDNNPRKFSVVYLKRIKSIFTRKARLYEKRFR
jgi:hypothetical protein